MTRKKSPRGWPESSESLTAEVKDVHRTLPHSIEAEQGVLGSMLISPREIIAECVEKINEEYFYVPAHQTVYSVLVDLWNKGQGIDLLTFTQVLRDRNLLDTVGGAGAVTGLFTFVPTAANITYYLEILRDKYLLRQIISTCQDGYKKAFSEQDEVYATLDEVQQRIHVIGEDNFKPKDKTLADHIADKIERMEKGEPDQDIIPTRIKELDRLSPLRRGDMPVLSGKRKSGKSIAALSILENICLSQEKPGLYFSLEDRTPKVVDRIFAGASRIPMGRHHVKNMSEEEIRASTKAAEKISKANLIIRDDVFDLNRIIAESHKALRKFPNLAIIVVDYGQLVRVNLKKGASREQEVATVSRTFRLFGMETGVPILVLSQENAQGNTRESTALEQDCTALWQIREMAGEPKKRKLEIPCQRNGESGVFMELCFLGEIARVENLHRPHDLIIDKNTA